MAWEHADSSLVRGVDRGPYTWADDGSLQVFDPGERFFELPGRGVDL